MGSIGKYYTSKKEGIPILSTKEISDKTINLNNVNYITKDFYDKNKKSQVFPNDLIIARHGNSGSSLVIPKFLKKAQVLNVIVVRSSKKFNSFFMEYMFDTYSIKSQMYALKAGSVQGVVNTKDIEKFCFNMPNIHEQNKIVYFLSFIDKKIELFNEKFELYNNFKKYCLQNLFSEKLRLITINNVEYDTVKNIFDVIPSKKYEIKKTQINESGDVIVVDQSSHIIAGYSDEQSKICNLFPLICFGDHTTNIKYIDKKFIIGGDGVKLLKPRIKSNIKYLYYALNRFNVHQEGYKRHFSILKNVKLPIFPIENQNFIANFLSAIDKKLDLTQNQIDLMENFKKGLLQQMFVYLIFYNFNFSHFNLF